MAGTRWRRTALAAATASHAPYTGNRAGCAVATAAERTFGGRCVETAAFNPSLTPLQTALVLKNLCRSGRRDPILRAVLVERPASSLQRASVEALLGALAPAVGLEYHEAVSPE